MAGPEGAAMQPATTATNIRSLHGQTTKRGPAFWCNHSCSLSFCNHYDHSDRTAGLRVVRRRGLGTKADPIPTMTLQKMAERVLTIAQQTRCVAPRLDAVGCVAINRDALQLLQQP